MSPIFDHEKLDVYKASLEFAAIVFQWLEKLPVKRGSILDQLERASSSISLNIAEGAGEFSRPEKARFYRMAKRSATECAAALDICRIHKILEDGAISQGKELLHRIAAMLVKMIQSMEMGIGDGK